MKRLKGYLANQLGFSEIGRYVLDEMIIPRLKDSGVIVLEPFAEGAKKFQVPVCKDNNYEQYVKEFQDFSWKITNENNALMKEADIMLPILDGGHTVDDGVAAEIGYYAGIKPDNSIIALRTDFRLAENLAAKVNCQILNYVNSDNNKLCTSTSDWFSTIELFIRLNGKC